MKKCYRVSEERNVLHRTNRKKTNWIGHILRRNCLLKHVTERKKERERAIKRERRNELRGRRKRRHKHIMDYLKETRGYWK
jgi:hypothetical protein